jgi:glycine dehydrogenase subunit 2
MIKAYIYIRMLGSEGLHRVSENAILNANYLMRKLEKHFLLPHEQHAMHEFVLSGDWQKEKGVKTLDIAKRLLDYGFHAPTVYFPLIVHEALMVEPTETESKETLDAFAEAMIAIAREAEEAPEKVRNAPANTPVSRLDEGLAARNLNVKYSE